MVWSIRTAPSPNGFIARPTGAGERGVVLETVNSSAYRDRSPQQIVPHMADAGRYLASESTLYRILRQEQQLAHRGRTKAPVRRAVAAHEATGPNQVWSWDITYLKSPNRRRVFLPVPDRRHLEPEDRRLVRRGTGRPSPSSSSIPTTLFPRRPSVSPRNASCDTYLDTHRLPREPQRRMDQCPVSAIFPFFKIGTFR